MKTNRQTPRELLTLLINDKVTKEDLSKVKLTNGEWYELKVLAEDHSDLDRSIIQNLMPTGSYSPARYKVPPQRDRTGEINILPNYFSINITRFDEEERGTGKNYIKISLNANSDPLSTSELNTFAKMFLDKNIADGYLDIEDLVFMPADALDYVNTQGKPMYVMECKDNGQYHYEFETHITTKSEVEHVHNTKLVKEQII